ncbi:hypothetical protein PspTeo4_21080 [Pseudomonas sp. Teo4]|nr:hypothetical protein [Pseudomonas sp. Teo4]
MTPSSSAIWGAGKPSIKIRSGRFTSVELSETYLNDGFIKHWMTMATCSSFSGLHSITCRLQIATLYSSEHWRSCAKA